jgi:hypothetical protein
MANPDGSNSTISGSPPLSTAPMAATSTGAYITSEQDLSVQQSWSISILLWFEFTACWKGKYTRQWSLLSRPCTYIPSRFHIGSK